MRFLFGNAALDTDREELRVAGDLVHLGPVGFALLVYLIENRGRVVSRAELHEAVWHGRDVAAEHDRNR